MSTTIQQIKAKLPLAPFVARYTGGLKSSGQGFFIGRCPFHQQPTDPPTKRKFWVSSVLNLCGCFVARCPAYCNRSEDPTSKPLDIINFYARLNNVTDQEAIEALKREASLNG